MLGASNLRQQKRLWDALGRPEMAKRSNEDRVAQREAERVALAAIMVTRTAREWEEFLQPRHIPAARVRDMFQDAPGVPGRFAVPVAPFLFEHGGPRVDAPPRALGADTDAVLAEHGYDEAARAALRAAGAI